MTNITTVINNNILVAGDVADLRSVPSVAAQLGGTPGHLAVQIDGQTLNAGSASQVAFLDGTMDYDATSAAALIVRLYNAALGRGPDAAGLAGWVAPLEDGQTTLQAEASAFVQSAEFQQIYGALTDSQFVTALYQNVLHRAPDASGLAAWTQALSGAAATGGQVVVGFSESQEHVVQMAPVIDDHGIVVAG